MTRAARAAAAKAATAADFTAKRQAFVDLALAQHGKQGARPSFIAAWELQTGRAKARGASHLGA